ncbi:hypothetical protein ACOME3_010068 [Neoechinorhynchus agilis]
MVVACCLSIEILYLLSVCLLENADNLLDFTTTTIVHLASSIAYQEIAIPVIEIPMQLKTKLINYLRLALLLSFIAVLACMGHTLRSHRVWILKGFRGKYPRLCARTGLDNITMIRKALQLPGYLIGQNCYIFIVILPISFGTLVFVSHVGPLLYYLFCQYYRFTLIPLLIVAKLVIVGLLVRSVFPERTVHIRVTVRNPKLMRIISNLNLLYDPIVGFIICLLRLPTGIWTQYILAGRCGKRTISKNLERYDYAYLAHASWIRVEVSQTHPVLLAFTELIMSEIVDKRNGVYPSDKFRKCIIFKYWILVTLSRNMSLIHYRKKVMQRSPSWAVGVMIC